MRRLRHSGPMGLVALIASAAVAAQAPPRDTNGPTAAQTRKAEAVLPGYRSFDADEPLRDWRLANDEAGRLGGHGGQLESTAPPHREQSGSSGNAGPHGEHR